MDKEQYISIIPKPKAKIPFLVNFLFILVLFLFIGSLGFYGLLRYEYSGLQGKEKSLDAQISAFENSDSKKLEVELMGLSKKITDFAKIFKERKPALGLFLFLQTSCHPKVMFTDVALSKSNLQISLEGETENFKTLGEQILILQSDKRVADLKLSDIALTQKGKVSFNLQLTLAPFLFAN